MSHPTDVASNRTHNVDLLDIALVVVQHLRLLIIGSLMAGMLALGISFVIKPTFTATIVLLTPQQQQGSAMAALQSLSALTGMAGAAAGIKNPTDQYVSLIQSTRIADRIIDKFKLMDVYDSEMRTDARKTLDRKTNVTGGKKDNLITITVDDTDPQRAADIANSYVDELRRLTKDLAITDAQQRRQFFDEQLTATKRKLSEAQKALQSSGINQGALRADPTSAALEYASIKAEVTAAEVKLQSMRGYLTESSPEIKLAAGNLKALRDQLVRAEASDTSSASNDYVSKLRDFKYYENLFELFSKEYELAKIDEARDGMLIQVIDAATPPERKSKPMKALIAILTTIGTGFLLLLFVLVRQFTRDARQTPETALKQDMLVAAMRSAFRRSGR
ncbi:MAG: GumC family protein [Leptothrix sp. (in: b-proteobacteria)]